MQFFVDLIAICCEEGEIVETIKYVYFKRNVSRGDYQQTNGIRSEIRIPTGKLFGLRKFDLIKTTKGIGFIKGKRSSGFFTISNLRGDVKYSSINVKRDCLRIKARTNTLIERGMAHSSTGQALVVSCA